MESALVYKFGDGFQLSGSNFHHQVTAGTEPGSYVLYQGPYEGKSIDASIQRTHWLVANDLRGQSGQILLGNVRWVGYDDVKGTTQAFQKGCLVKFDPVDHVVFGGVSLGYGKGGRRGVGRTDPGLSAVVGQGNRFGQVLIKSKGT